jgi:hypothetical protein
MRQTKEDRLEELHRTITKMISVDKSEVLLLPHNVVYLYHGQVKVVCLRSLFIFKGDNPIRRFAVWTVDWK